MPGEDQNWGRYAGIGLEICAGVLLGVLVGYWLDSRYGWTPIGTLIGSLLGIAGGMYLVIRQAMRMNKD